MYSTIQHNKIKFVLIKFFIFQMCTPFQNNNNIKKNNFVFKQKGWHTIKSQKGYIYIIYCK